MLQPKCSPRPLCWWASGAAWLMPASASSRHSTRSRWTHTFPPVCWQYALPLSVCQFQWKIFWCLSRISFSFQANNLIALCFLPALSFWLQVLRSIWHFFLSMGWHFFWPRSYWPHTWSSRPWLQLPVSAGWMNWLSRGYTFLLVWLFLFHLIPALCSRLWSLLSI